MSAFLWLDDVRVAPDGWTWVKTAKEALALLESGTVEHASLDHDLGYMVNKLGENGLVMADHYDFEEPTGSHLADWMVEKQAFPTKTLTVHSFNPAGGQRMIQIFGQAQLRGATFELFYKPFKTP